MKFAIQTFLTLLPYETFVFRIKKYIISVLSEVKIDKEVVRAQKLGTDDLFVHIRNMYGVVRSR